jgi:hypothetical protein
MTTNETAADTWCLPIRPVPVPADVEASLARAERDAFLARHAPADLPPLSIFSGRGDDAGYGR